MTLEIKKLHSGFTMTRNGKYETAISDRHELEKVVADLLMEIVDLNGNMYLGDFKGLNINVEVKTI